MRTSALKMKSAERGIVFMGCMIQKTRVRINRHWNFCGRKRKNARKTLKMRYAMNPRAEK
jgi:hypothetical protein